ncbi:MAG TPA: methyltransferase [Elusimicrobia bacterium]|nr:methyltransferase [Elusimicrobiota bacterium]HBT60274.1 methyltransferase [Elusimicrobiota bacterium]
MKPYKEITKCRICANRKLLPILSLGRQSLTGVFPKSPRQRVTSGPLDLVKCDDSQGEHCGLVQLRQSYSTDEMYGDNYGYHSGLNPSMVRHLHGKVRQILARVCLEPGDLVVDIGSNDGTLLKAYPTHGPTLVGVDPTGHHFRRYYPPYIRLIPDYFSAALIQRAFPGRQAKVVTAISMFYDLESPLAFLQEIRNILAPNGILVLEQSYMPTMLARNSYDTICHEHLEYYGVKQIDWMAKRCGLRVIDVELNDVNGGSFSITLSRDDGPHAPQSKTIARFLKAEAKFRQRAPFNAFRRHVERHREELLKFFRQARKRGQTVVGYGASTKGNVILQYCGLTARDIPCIGEVNEEKFGSYTPGTLIPIVPEKKARAMRPDYMLVLPWHFKSFFLRKEKPFLKSGGKLFFPLPSLEIH